MEEGPDEAMMRGDDPSVTADEVRVVYVDDGDTSPVNALLDEGWRLLACGVAEQREVGAAGVTRSFARCAFILGRARGEHVLEEATAVVEAAVEAEPIVTIPAPK